MRFGRAAFRFISGIISPAMLGGVGGTGGPVAPPAAALKYNRTANSQYLSLTSVGGM